MFAFLICLPFSFLFCYYFCYCCTLTLFFEKDFILITIPLKKQHNKQTKFPKNEALFPCLSFFSKVLFLIYQMTMTHHIIKSLYIFFSNIYYHNNFFFINLNGLRAIFTITWNYILFVSILLLQHLQIGCISEFFIIFSRFFFLKKWLLISLSVGGYLFDGIDQNESFNRPCTLNRCKSITPAIKCREFFLESIQVLTCGWLRFFSSRLNPFETWKSVFVAVGMVSMQSILICLAFVFYFNADNNLKVHSFRWWFVVFCFCFC